MQGLQMFICVNRMKATMNGGQTWGKWWDGGQELISYTSAVILC